MYSAGIYRQYSSTLNDREMSLDSSGKKVRKTVLGQSNLSFTSINRSEVEEDKDYFIRTLTNNIRKQSTQKDRRMRRDTLGGLDGIIHEETGQPREYLDETDHGMMTLTQDFHDELELIGREEASKLCHASARPATPDLFGIPRKKCEACPDGRCGGYLPEAVLCPNPNSGEPFPTFCTDCGCPASFHQMVRPRGELPEQLSDALRSFDITQSELNFNSCLLLLQVQNDKQLTSNLGVFFQILRQHNLEPLAMETRQLEVHEALYLRCRQFYARDAWRQLLDDKGAGIHRRDARAGLLNAAANGDLDHMIEQIKYFKHSKKDPRTSTLKYTQSTLQFNVTAGSLAPEKPKGHKFTLKNTSQYRSDAIKGRRFHQTQAKISFWQIMELADEQPELRKLLQNKYVVLVVGSTQVNRIPQLLKDQLVPTFFRQLPRDSLALSYISGPKVDAMEDTLLMMPYLYKLQKSIVIAEPAGSFFDSVRKSNVDAQGAASRAMTGIELSRTLSGVAPKQTGLSGTTQVPQPPLQRQGTSRSAFQRTLSTKLRATLGQEDLKSIRKMDLRSAEKKQMEESMEATFAQLDKEANEGDSVATHKSGRIVESKWTTSDLNVNRYYVNYGTMLDFFDYSGIRLQAAKRYCDLRRPASFGFVLLPDDKAKVHYEKQLEQESSTRRKANVQCNMFAVAQMGQPNMILPQTLDVLVRNYQHESHYLEVADHFFPEHARNQITVIVLRPMIVRNGLSDYIVGVLRANGFIILDRCQVKLSRSQAAALCRMEKVNADQAELYIDIVMSSPNEVVVCSKIGAVQDARSIVHGSLTGRRRANQLDEPDSKSVSTTDSVGAMFEIAPFSSCNELIDLQDFITGKNLFAKYKRPSKQEAAQFLRKDIDQLTHQKTERTLAAIQLFQRQANLAGFAAATEAEAHQLLGTFTPWLAKIEEVILVLNPLYNNLLPKIEELLIRMRYGIANRREVMLTREELQELLGERFENYGLDRSAKAFNKLLDTISTSNFAEKYHFFHLAKVAGDLELRQYYEQAGLDLMDHAEMNEDIRQHEGPLRPTHIPHMFLNMDTEPMFERALEHLVGKEQRMFTASRFRDRELDKPTICQIIETAVFTNLGQSVLKVAQDPDGKLHNDLLEKQTHGQAVLSRNVRGNRFSALGGCEEIHQLQQQFSAPDIDDGYVSYAVEGERHDLFEVRFHRVHQQGDASSHTFAVVGIKDQPAPEDDDYMLEKDGDGEGDQGDAYSDARSLGKSTMSAGGGKRVTFMAERGRKYRKEKQLNKKQEVNREQLFYFQKFNAINYYYKRVNIEQGPGLVPSYYRYKIAPLDYDELSRVYEIEEHVGRPFIDELAEMHLSHLKQRANLAQKQKVNKTGMAMALDDLEQEVAEGKRQSLPAFLMGNALAKLVKQLEAVKAPDMIGAGSLRYSRKAKQMQGGCDTPQEYFEYNKDKYEDMRRYLEPFLPLFISQLEAGIIYAKFDAIINSLTFKYSRQAEMLRLIPDRVTQTTLRINSVVAIRNEDADKDPEASFYKDIYGDPDRPKDLESRVVSVLDAVQRDRVIADKATDKLREVIAKKLNPKKWTDEKVDAKSIRDMSRYKDDLGFRATMDEGLLKPKGKLIEELKDTRPFTIHKQPAVSASEVGKRPRLQLFAACLYHLDFYLRKVHRRVELFYGQQAGISDAEAVEEYDALLDAIVKGLKEGYGGEDAMNEVLDIIALKRGYDSQFAVALKDRARRAKKSEKDLEDAMEKRHRIDDHAEGLENIKFDYHLRNHKDLGWADLLDLTQKNDRDKLQIQAVQGFLDVRGKVLDQFDTDDMREFRKAVEGADVALGPYLEKLAKDFIIRMRMQQDSRYKKHSDDQKGIQERISLVKMEYFLYTFTETHRIVREIRHQQAYIQKCQRDIEDRERLLSDLLVHIRQDRGSFATDAERRANELDEDRQEKEIKEQIDRLQNAIPDSQYKIARREFELLLVLRELMSIDIYAPDYCFDGDLVRKREKGDDDIMEVPLKTFWIPVEAKEPTAKEFLVPLKPKEQRDWDAIGLPEHMARLMEDNALRDEMDLAEELRRRHPAAINMAREPEGIPDYPEKLAFAKFKFGADVAQEAEMDRLRRQLTEKIGKETHGLDYKPTRKEKKTEHPQQSGLDLDAIDDPFAMLKKKEMSNQIVQETIENFLLMDKEANTIERQKMLNATQAKRLAMQALEGLSTKGVKRVEYSEFDFDTAMQMYGKDGGRRLPVKELTKFLKNVADL